MNDALPAVAGSLKCINACMHAASQKNQATNKRPQCVCILRTTSNQSGPSGHQQSRSTDCCQDIQGISWPAGATSLSWSIHWHH